MVRTQEDFLYDSRVEEHQKSFEKPLPKNNSPMKVTSEIFQIFSSAIPAIRKIHETHTFTETEEISVLMEEVCCFLYSLGSFLDNVMRDKQYSYQRAFFPRENPPASDIQFIIRDIEGIIDVFYPFMSYEEGEEFLSLCFSCHHKLDSYYSLLENNFCVTFPISCT